MESPEYTLSGNGMQVDRLVSSIACALARAGVSDKLVLRCQLVVEEMATNAVHHGGASDVFVDVAISERIRLDIRDDGAAFDPFSTPVPDLSLNLDQRSVGGLGLHLIRSWNSVTHYVRDGRFNVTSVEIGP
jgi:anti-sigma regulatory factor (Ser/Thr protein kinase)